MNNKKKLRLKLLNAIVVITFVLAIVFTFIDISISRILLMASFSTTLLNITIRVFWVKIKELKGKRKL